MPLNAAQIDVPARIRRVTERLPMHFNDIAKARDRNEKANVIMFILLLLRSSSLGHREDRERLDNEKLSA